MINVNKELDVRIDEIPDLVESIDDSNAKVLKNIVKQYPGMDVFSQEQAFLTAAAFKWRLISPYLIHHAVDHTEGIIQAAIEMGGPSAKEFLLNFISEKGRVPVVMRDVVFYLLSCAYKTKEVVEAVENHGRFSYHSFEQIENWKTVEELSELIGQSKFAAKAMAAIARGYKERIDGGKQYDSL